MATNPQPAESSLPPQAVLYHLAIGHYVSRALNLAARLGIADLVKDGPRPVHELADATATHVASLQRVLRLLVSVGIFEERTAGTFGLTRVGEFLRGDVPGSALAMVKLFCGPPTQEAWKELEYCVRTGEPAYRKRGIADRFVELAQNPEEAADFDAAMADFTRLAAVAVAATYDFASLRSVTDVGGGNGALLIGILGAHPHLRGVVFDRPDVVERAREQIARRGLAERCEAVGGSFFEEVPRGADAYLLKHVIHDWDDERARKILENCRRAMEPSAKLLLIEGVYPARMEQSLACRGAAANDVNMLVNTGGRQRTEEEFRSLYDAAGFQLTRIVPTPINISVIEGVPRRA